MNVRVGVRISGRVQGVSFRYATLRQARSLEVSGWVSNLPDGDVEGCFEGEESAVTALVEWCRSGPPAARVEQVTISRQEYTGEFQGFMIRE
jgi:acylphosphatase